MPVTEEDLAPGQNLEQLVCSICLFPFKDPVFAEGICQCVFCRKCIEQSLQVKKKCPLCAKSMYPETLKQHRWVSNALGDLKVKCPNNCAWTGPYESRDHHVRSCVVTKLDQELAKIILQLLEATEEERVGLEEEKQRLQERRAELTQGPPGVAGMPSEALVVELRQVKAELQQVKATLAARDQELHELKAAAAAGTPGGAPEVGGLSGSKPLTPEEHCEDLKRALRGSLRDLGEDMNSKIIAKRIRGITVHSSETMLLIADEIVKQATAPGAPVQCFAEAVLELSRPGVMPELPDIITSQGTLRGFAKYIGITCQDVYESPTLDSDQLETSNHQKTLRVLRFLGHLFMKGVFGRKFLDHVISELCTSLQELGVGAVRDSKVEQLCDLLKIVGRKFNTTSTRGNLRLVQVFTLLDNLQTGRSENGSPLVSTAIHYKIEDLILLARLWA